MEKLTGLMINGNPAGDMSAFQPLSSFINGLSGSAGSSGAAYEYAFSAPETPRPLTASAPGASG